MKPWRLVLLVLLVALLPLRGVMAATMLCPPGNHGHGAGVAAGAAEHAHQGHHHPADEAPADASVGSHGSSCHVCASFCSATPLLATMPVVLQPAEARTLSYAEWAAPAPLFVSGRQERPPRST